MSLLFFLESIGQVAVLAGRDICCVLGLGSDYETAKNGEGIAFMDVLKSDLITK